MSETQDPVGRLKQFTAARIGLGRTGNALPTQALLQFQQDFAAAKDAVYGSFDRDHFIQQLGSDEQVIEIQSCAPNRQTYLQRPDWGRRLNPECFKKLKPGPFDLVIVVADGLSARAVQENAAPLIRSLQNALPELQIGPLFLAHQARVALGDEVAIAVKAEMVLVLIGERPGLSAADSMGAYLTFDPKIDTADSARNCVSNIRPFGLKNDEACSLISYLIREARRLKLTGVALKDQRDLMIAAPSA